MTSTQRTWLVTGASSGFGTEISLAALQKGDKVVGTARNVRKAEQNNPDFTKLGGHWLELDVTSPNCEEVVARAVKQHNVDVLINNAGYAEGGTLEDSSMTAIRAQFETNVFGALAVLKGTIPHFRTHRRGTVVNISSTAAIAPHCYFSSYAATKFALEGASESLAEELSPFNIRVLIVEPGAFRTSFFGALQYTTISEVYKGTVVEETVKAFEAIDGTQPGDPVKAGKAIVDVVRGEGRGKEVQGNLRVQLGTDAVVKTRDKAKRLREDWSRGEEVGNSCAYDS
ncbi:hypothetical protein M409DRAFT_20108 [Zasmidium cellare ATCC 36951]|uniref:Uncharacterized protein n=1 Tax=Zasmidium cellare ATCC 36951 TaxID=1080233 RepID=A0A6A6CV58_ZASCE|nr:uncharacterized protein M409DRAFT_20108 [Zasmidium cellare ATCC 36951]KAF2169692.1 hypothetical protein M409DRAFT_20108 [Zasmidium cellare ATCC 36951]